MTKQIKSLVIIAGALIAIGLSAFIAYAVYVFAVFSNMAAIPGNTDEELNEYTKEKWGRSVSVLKREGQTAEVQTNDREGIVFSIELDEDGNIQSNNFKEAAGRFDLNEHFSSVEEVKKLKDLGFTRLNFGRVPEEQDFSLDLPDGRLLFESESWPVLFDALPLFRSLDEKVGEETGYPLGQIFINGRLFDVTQHYDSPEAIGHRLAEDDPSIFYPNFYTEDQQLLANALEILEVSGFSTASVRLKCMELRDYHSCGSYEVSMQVRGEEKESFSFNHSHKEELLSIIQVLQGSDLPIVQLRVLGVEKEGFIDRLEGIRTVDDLHMEEEARQTGVPDK